MVKKKCEAALPNKAKAVSVRSTVKVAKGGESWGVEAAVASCAHNDQRKQEDHAGWAEIHCRWQEGDNEEEAKN